MKNLLFVTLLMLPCAGTSQGIDTQLLSTRKPDSLKIAPEQVKEIYFGLRSSEIYRRNFNDCLEAAEALNGIIQKQKDSIISLDQRLEEYDYQLGELYDERERAAVEIQKIKPSRTPWYKHPIFWGLVGFGAGIFIVK